MRLCLLGLVALALSADPAAADLLAYVRKTDDSYGHKVVRDVALPGGARMVSVELISQTWRGKKWTHALTLLRPAKVTQPDAALLVITGGRNGRKTPRELKGGGLLLLLAAAQRMGCTLAVLRQVPNQPLMEGRKEDALIAHTFDQYLKTKDPSWPLLLPMTKAAVRAMDAVAELSLRLHGVRTRRFGVTGGSKRGWTTWLTAASDPRVVAIAPMVIDTLDITRQMAYQVQFWGAFSDSIRDYTSLDLPRRMKADPAGEALVRMVDPFHHRHRIQIPKLICIGTNDPYWPVDAARHYFDQLPGERFLHVVPNAGHGLKSSVIPQVASFFSRVFAGTPRPRLVWQARATDAGERLTVLADRATASVKVWEAEQPSRDFRTATWTARELTAARGGSFAVEIARPAAGRHRAAFIQLAFDDPIRGRLELCTRVHVVSAAAVAVPGEPSAD